MKNKIEMKIILKERDSVPLSDGRTVRYWADVEQSTNFRCEYEGLSFLLIAAHHKNIAGITLKASFSQRRAFDIAFNLSTNQVIVYDDLYFYNDLDINHDVVYILFNTHMFPSLRAASQTRGVHISRSQDSLLLVIPDDSI